MKQLFENEYMEIGSNDTQGILEVICRKPCGDVHKLNEHLSIINQYVKDTHKNKLILQLDNLYEISKESLLSEKFLPFIGDCGVKNIAVITGENKKVQSLISELDFYLSPVKKQYQIQSESFETYDQAIRWLISE